MKKSAGSLLPVLAGLGGISIVVAFAILIMVNRSRSALEHQKAALELRGETLDIARLMPPLPLAGSNGADALIAAGDALKAAVTKNALKPYQSSQADTSSGQAEVLHRRHAALRLKKDVSWEDFRQEMELLRPQLADVRRAATALVLEIQPDYTQGLSMPLKFISPFLSCGQFLKAESLIFLHDGNTTAAAENIETTLRLAGITTRQPILISRLVAVALAGLCQANTWEFLQANPSPKDLERVQTAWENFSLLSGIPSILRMERATGSPSFASPVDTLKTIASFSTSSSAARPSVDKYLQTAEWTLWSVVFRYGDEGHFIASFQDLIDRLEKGDTWQSVLAAAHSQELALSSAGLSRKMSILAIPTIRNSLEKFVSQAALQSLTITAIAIRRYQNDHKGQPPETLENLIPSYLAALPVDPMNGEPLRYQRQGDHFLLYAVGENGVDDGGDPSPIPGKKFRGPSDGLDIVWPRPVVSP